MTSGPTWCYWQCKRAASDRAWRGDCWSWLLDSARTAGIAELSLELRAGNAGARAFYRAMGFSDAGLLPGYYRNREPALRMVRVLRISSEPAQAWQAPTLRRP